MQECKKKFIYLIFFVIILSFAGVLFACGDKSEKSENPDIPPVPEVSYQNNILTIKPVGGCEYSLSDTDWQDANVFNAESFRDYFVYIRYKETSTHFASLPNAAVFFTAEFEGRGTPSSPYLIYTANDLKNIKYAMSATYKLMHDIDLGGGKWTPLGMRAGGYTDFTGAFYGNNKTISNFSVAPDGECRGLFGKAASSVFSGLTISNARFAGGGEGGNNSDYYAGALVGRAENVAVENIVLNCIEFEINGSGVKAGALVGEIATAGTIRNIIAEDIKFEVNSVEEIASQTFIGGIAGRIMGFTNYFIYLNGIKSEMCFEVLNAYTGNHDNNYEYELYSVGGICGFANNASLTDIDAETKIFCRDKTGEAIITELWFGGITGQLRYCTIDNVNVYLGVRADTVLFRGGGIAGNGVTPGKLVVTGAAVSLDVDILGTNVPAIGGSDSMQLAFGGVVGRGNAEITSVQITGVVNAARNCGNNFNFILAGGVAGYSGEITIRRVNTDLKMSVEEAMYKGYAGGLVALGGVVDIEGATVHGSIEVRVDGDTKEIGIMVFCGGIAGGMMSGGTLTARYVVISAAISNAHRQRAGGLIGEGEIVRNGTVHNFTIYIDSGSGVYYDTEISLDAEKAPYKIIGDQTGNYQNASAAQATAALKDAQNGIYNNFPSYFVFSSGDYPYVRTA